jgi:hypothetical protein
MKARSLLLLLPALPASMAHAESGGLHTLAIVPEIPVVNVAPQPPGRHLFQLPALDYVFRVQARCHDEWKPESLSLTVADSRVFRTAAELVESSNHQLEMQIPANQLAPLAMRNFCMIEEAQEGSDAAGSSDGMDDETAGNLPEAPEVTIRELTTRQLTIDAALSAHASLRCSNGEEQKTVYVSQPLDVTLVCEMAETADGSPGR